MKKFVILLMLIAIFTCLSMVFASNEGGFVDISTDPKEPDGVGTMTGKILGAIQYFGYAVAIGMLIYVGIKYMLSAASEKAELKQVAINYVIGAIIIVSATTLFSTIVKFAESTKEESPQQVLSEY